MPITPAQLTWDGSQPRTAQFDDIYHSADGIAESQRVFLVPSNISAQARSQSCVCVAELGFGTGLNFAVCAQHVLDASPSTQLRFVSFEKHPLKASDWAKVCDLQRKKARLQCHSCLAGISAHLPMDASS